jgi:hypothetical protein
MALFLPVIGGIPLVSRGTLRQPHDFLLVARRFALDQRLRSRSANRSSAPSASSSSPLGSSFT